MSVLPTSTAGNTEPPRVSDKGQTTIPKELRGKYGIEPGDTVVWEDTDDGIVIRKVIGDPGRGMWLDGDLSPDEREELARELEDEIRDRRDSEWAVEERRMRRYTLDASGLIRYVVDRLPPGADDIVRDAFDGEAILEEMLDRQDEFPRQLHDAVIVASHVVNDTEAVISSDEKIADHVPTVWQYTAGRTSRYVQPGPGGLVIINGYVRRYSPHRALLDTDTVVPSEARNGALPRSVGL